MKFLIALNYWLLYLVTVSATTGIFLCYLWQIKYPDFIVYTAFAAWPSYVFLHFIRPRRNDQKSATKI